MSSRTIKVSEVKEMGGHYIEMVNVRYGEEILSGRVYRVAKSQLYAHDKVSAYDMHGVRHYLFANNLCVIVER